MIKIKNVINAPAFLPATTASLLQCICSITFFLSQTYSLRMQQPAHISILYLVWFKNLSICVPNYHKYSHVHFDLHYLRVQPAQDWHKIVIHWIHIRTERGDNQLANNHHQKNRLDNINIIQISHLHTQNIGEVACLTPHELRNRWFTRRDMSDFVLLQKSQ